VILASKVFANHLRYQQVIDACHATLKNLRTDYLDLYQIHWPPGSFGQKPVPLEEPLQALNDLKTQGKIRAIGVSNFNRAQLEEAGRTAAIESLQPPYSLFWRMIEKETLPFCRERGLTVLAYSPMAQGLLTGKFGPDHRFAKGDHRAGNRLFKEPNFARAQQALAQLRPIADQHGVTLGQLALAWVIAQPGVCAIAGARNPEQATQNAAAATIHLSQEDLATLDRIGRTVTDELDDNPVQWN
jgi:aryl-alcohol dehydrogenase-like predicted oxidoreductase